MTEPRIGDLRHLLRLEKPMMTPDGGGGGTSAHALVAEIWTELRPRGAGEQGAADGVQSFGSYEIWLRWRPGVTPEMRFVAGTRVFDITGVVDVGERRRWLKCLATERRP